MKGAGAKTKKAKVTSTPFNPAAWSEKTRMIADGSYLDISRNVTVGQHDVIRDLAKKEKEDRSSKVGNSALTSKGEISNPFFFVFIETFFSSILSVTVFTCIVVLFSSQKCGFRYCPL